MSWRWDLDKLEHVISRARGGRVVVLQFHGVPDTDNPALSIPPERFREFLAWLKKEGCRVVALRDLADFHEPVPLPADPNTSARFPNSR